LPSALLSFLVLANEAEQAVRTELSPDNPHKPGRYSFAWEKTPAGSLAHLDLGCHEGGFLDSLASKRIGRLAGADVSRDAIEAGRRRYSHLELMHVTVGGPLPFSDATFTSITLLDVIEHVPDQTVLLNELRRVLRDDGCLIVTAPGQHLLSFLDAGNFKFRFPRLHKWYYCRHHSPEEYEYRYVSNPDGRVGDVSARKRWHEHFSRAKMRSSLEGSGFQVVEFDGAGFWSRLISLVALCLPKTSSLQRLTRRVLAWDARHFESRDLFCVARKRL